MKKHLLIVVLQLASAGADAWSTHRTQSSPFGHEYNPIARVFVTHGTGAQIAYFAGQTGLKLYAPHWLREHHHGKLATSVELFGIADNASGATASILNGKW